MSKQHYAIETFCLRCEDLHAGAVKMCSRCGCADLRSWVAPSHQTYVMGAAERRELPPA